MPSSDTFKNKAPSSKWAMITIGAATVKRMRLLRRRSSEGRGVLCHQTNLIVASLLQTVHHRDQPAIQDRRIAADKDPLL